MNDRIGGGIFCRIRWIIRVREAVLFDTFNERSIFKLVFYILSFLAILYSFITVFMPYYPNSSLSEPLTKAVGADQKFLDCWSALSKHGAISCEVSGVHQLECSQNGAVVDVPLSKYLRDGQTAFDMFVVPDMFGTGFSVYVDKHRADIPLGEAQKVISDVVTRLTIMRSYASEY